MRDIARARLLIGLSAPLLLTVSGGCHGSARNAAVGAIEVVEASYGGNCGVAAGNATASVANGCNRRLNCDYEIRRKWLGDPAPDCTKDFVVRYRCGPDAPLRRVKVDAEAGFGSVVSLTCE
jgi:hypothetical protein